MCLFLKEKLAKGMGGPSDKPEPLYSREGGNLLLGYKVRGGGEPNRIGYYREKNRVVDAGEGLL